MEGFRDDPTRQVNKKPYQIIVSKHPYDVMGASTDRNWTSCVDLGGEGISYKDDFKRKNKSSDENFNAEPLVKSLGYPYFVSYLVDPDDVTSSGKPALRKPLGRIMIYPFVNNEDETNYNWSVGDVYGMKSDKFDDITERWVRGMNEKYSIPDADIYSPITQNYYDNFDTEVVKIFQSEDEIMDDAEKNIKNIDVGTYDESTHYLYDVTFNRFIQPLTFKYTRKFGQEFYDTYVMQLLSELVFVLVGEVGDIEDTFDMVNDIYENGQLMLNPISIAGLNLRDNEMEDIVSDDPYYPLKQYIERLKNIDSEYGHHVNSVNIALLHYLERMDAGIQDELIEIGVDPDVTNWEQVSDRVNELNDEIRYELG